MTTNQLAAARRSRHAGTVFRLLLALSLLVLGARAATMPAQRSLSDLERALSRGTVQSVRVELPGPGTSGRYEAVWSTGSWRDNRSPHDVKDGRSPELLALIAASPKPVQVTTYGPQWSGAVYVNYWAMGGLLIVYAALCVLMLIRQPRLATRWAWFWLAVSLPVATLLFLVLEPHPLWRGDVAPSRYRLTGGKALVAGLVVAAVGRALFPSLTGIFWSVGPGSSRIG